MSNLKLDRIEKSICDNCGYKTGKIKSGEPTIIERLVDDLQNNLSVKQGIEMALENDNSGEFRAYLKDLL
jgi:hypothetical protein